MEKPQIILVLISYFLLKFNLKVTKKKKRTEQSTWYFHTAGFKGLGRHCGAQDYTGCVKGPEGKKTMVNCLNKSNMIDVKVI